MSNYLRSTGRNELADIADQNAHFLCGDKDIYNDPEKYFTDDIMQQLDEAAQKEFSYGVS